MIYLGPIFQFVKKKVSYTTCAKCVARIFQGGGGGGGGGHTVSKWEYLLADFCNLLRLFAEIKLTKNEGGGGSRATQKPTLAMPLDKKCQSLFLILSKDFEVKSIIDAKQELYLRLLTVIIIIIFTCVMKDKCFSIE